MTKKNKISTLEMEIALMSHFEFRRNLIVHNITGMNRLLGFEADVLTLSAASFATCVEIKVSKADLKADLKKAHIHHLDSPMKWLPNRSAKQLYYKNLKYFYYAVPEELKEEALRQIPDFAGLLVAELYDFNDNRPPKIIFSEVKSPTRLFLVKWTDKMRYEMARLGAMRIYGLKQKILCNTKARN